MSIIVPAYNVAEYIESCLNSLLVQTHEEIEIVVVDDGSTDETAAVCAAVARRDARVRIITQPNAGVSAARNRGVQEARGTYVCFVDSDDAAHPDMVARLLAALSTAGAEIACAGRYAQFSASFEPTELGSSDAQTLSGEEACAELLYQRIPNGPWAKMFVRSAVGEEPFDNDVCVGEDLLMNLDVMSQAAHIVVVDDALYGYRQHDASTMHSVRREDRMRLVTEIEARREEELSAAFDNRLCAEALYMVFEASTAAERRSALALMKRYRRVVLSDAQSLPQLRIYAAASYAGAWLPVAIHEWKARGAHR
ncbi:glycosyltransferase family 2 protein [Corynebacterium sp. SA-MJD20WY100]|uniref:glycosyltransferase family 2 protein n=1 Tax=Corynebacterium sp. SA-MJD20WY100 TaxID=3142969 RepID=UPI00322141B1